PSVVLDCRVPFGGRIPGLGESYPSFGRAARKVESKSEWNERMESASGNGEWKRRQRSSLRSIDGIHPERSEGLRIFHSLFPLVLSTRSFHSSFPLAVSTAPFNAALWPPSQAPANQPASIDAQRDARVDADRAPRWEIARQQHDRCETTGCHP